MIEDKTRQDNIKKWREAALKDISRLVDHREIGANSEAKIVVVRDTLTNLMHWCDEHKINFEGQLAVAKHHFEKELEGEI